MKTLSNSSVTNLMILFLGKGFMYLFLVCLITTIKALTHNTIPSDIIIMMGVLSVLFLSIGIALSIYKRRQQNEGCKNKIAD